MGLISGYKVKSSSLLFYCSRLCVTSLSTLRANRIAELPEGNCHDQQHIVASFIFKTANVFASCFCGSHAFELTGHRDIGYTISRLHDNLEVCFSFSAKGDLRRYQYQI